MQSPIQKLLLVLEHGERMNHNNGDVNSAFTTIIKLVNDLNLPKQEMDALNKAFNDGRFYKPHIEKQITNYFKQEYNGKKD
jgi:hypothetical protein